jgi:Zn-dependent alcohol dehydrogenase
MPKMPAVEVTSPKGPFKVVEREIPQPGPRQVRVKVQACGLCHSDSMTKEGLWPGITYPRVPGHEIAGVIDAVGDEVPEWRPGRRVGIGWYGGHCGYCESCRRGDFITCRNGRLIPDAGRAEARARSRIVLRYVRGARAKSAHDRSAVRSGGRCRTSHPSLHPASLARYRSACPQNRS